MPADFEEMARRRGFFWQSSELYGGLAGFYDYGHLGALVKRKWENLWRGYFLGLGDNFFEIEPAHIMHEKVFVGSGHVKCFVDPVVKCRKCGNIERADHILEDVLHERFEGITPEHLSDIIITHNVKCQKCKGPLEEVSVFNMLFPLSVGAEQTDALNRMTTSSSTSSASNRLPQKAYLRGETAQGVYVNFPRIFEHLRKQLPLGLAIVGRAYRNEISPRGLLLRMREFTQAELQIFFDADKINKHPDFDSVASYQLLVLPAGQQAAEKQKGKKEGTEKAKAEKAETAAQKMEKISCADVVKAWKLPEFYVYYMAKVQQFYLSAIGVPAESFRFRQLSDEEKAFYNKYHFDVELRMAAGWKEVGGVHYRTDHDLAGHQSISKKDMAVTIDGKKIVPHVLELSLGVDRNILALLERAYVEEKERSVLKFPRVLSPFDCAVFPLVNKDGMPERAQNIKKALQAAGLNVFYDDSGSIGRRYRRMDEIGTAVCITVDGQTLQDATVTLRDRDSMKQVRVRVEDLFPAIKDFLRGKDLEELV